MIRIKPEVQFQDVILDPDVKNIEDPSDPSARIEDRPANVVYMK